jgi:eukaryotic-like serine/threonine-protein kinase
MVGENSLLHGRYLLNKKAGQGGFAQVFLATDQTLKRRVAVKVLNANLFEDDSFLRRFEQEAQSVAALEHPNILPVYDYGQADDTVYLVMPFVEGGTLHEKLRKQQKFNLQEANLYLQQIASALDYAHRRNIVHRDVKPQNVLIREEDNRAFLADFGIAKVLSAANTNSNTNVVGTIAYMAPEQLDGKAVLETDVYALGCVLFQMLTGELPYTGTTEQVMVGHMMKPIPSINERTEGKLPALLQPLFEKAMAKDRANRYKSAGEFAKDYEEVITGLAQNATIALPNALTKAVLPETLPKVPSVPAPPTQYTTPVERPSIPSFTSYTPTHITPPNISNTGQPQGIAPTPNIGQPSGFVPPVFGGQTQGSAPTSITGQPQGNTPFYPPPVISPPPMLVAETAKPKRKFFLPVLGIGGIVAIVAIIAITIIAVSDNRRDNDAPRNSSDNQNNQAKFILRGHVQEVMAVAFSPDGKTLASGSIDHTVRLWDVDNGKMLREWSAHKLDSGDNREVFAVAFSSNGKILASGGGDNLVRLWNPDTGSEIRVLRGHTDEVRTLAFDSSGTILYSAGKDRTIRQWNVDTGKELSKIEVPEAVYGIALKKDALQIAVALENAKTIVYNLNNKALTEVIAAVSDVSANGGNDYAVAFSADNRYLVIGNTEQGNRRFDLKDFKTDPKFFAEIEGGIKTVGIAYSRDGKFIASGSSDQNNSLIIWDANNGKIIRRFEGHEKDYEGRINSVAFHPSENIIATGSNDKTIRIWKN